jgi:hypothetical protein
MAKQAAMPSRRENLPGGHWFPVPKAYLSIDNILWFEAVALLPLPTLAG